MRRRRKADGTPWVVGVENPDTDSGKAYLATVELADNCVVTSGDYQRYYEVDNQRYCHIIDPHTNMPPDFFLLLPYRLRIPGLPMHYRPPCLIWATRKGWRWWRRCRTWRPCGLERMEKFAIPADLKPMKKNDVILIAVLLAFALAAFGGVSIRSALTTNEPEAVVYLDGEEWGRYPLSKDTEVEIRQEGDHYNILQIRRGKQILRQPPARIESVSITVRSIDRERVWYVCRTG